MLRVAGWLSYVHDNWATWYCSVVHRVDSESFAVLGDERRWGCGGLLSGCLPKFPTASNSTPQWFSCMSEPALFRFLLAAQRQNPDERVWSNKYAGGSWRIEVQYGIHSAIILSAEWCNVYLSQNASMRRATQLILECIIHNFGSGLISSETTPCLTKCRLTRWRITFWVMIATIWMMIIGYHLQAALW